MYFAPDGPWAEPNSRGARFFPRIRPTLACSRIRQVKKSSGPGQWWLGARPPTAKPGAWYLGHTPFQIWGQSWVQFPGEGVFDFFPRGLKKCEKSPKNRQNCPRAAPALSFRPAHARAPRAGRSVG